MLLKRCCHELAQPPRCRYYSSADLSHHDSDFHQRGRLAPGGVNSLPPTHPHPSEFEARADSAHVRDSAFADSNVDNAASPPGIGQPFRIQFADGWQRQPPTQAPNEVILTSPRPKTHHQTHRRENGINMGPGKKARAHRQTARQTLRTLPFREKQSPKLHKT